MFLEERMVAEAEGGERYCNRENSKVARRG